MICQVCVCVLSIREEGNATRVYRRMETTEGKKFEHVYTRILCENHHREELRLGAQEVNNA